MDEEQTEHCAIRGCGSLPMCEGQPRERRDSGQTEVARSHLHRCHGADLRGSVRCRGCGNSPSYLARQLYDMQTAIAPGVDAVDGAGRRRLSREMCWQRAYLGSLRHRLGMCL